MVPRPSKDNRFYRLARVGVERLGFGLGELRDKEDCCIEGPPS